MLVPFFYGWRKLTLYPACFILLLVQLFFYFESAIPQAKNQKQYQKIMENPDFYNETAYAYSQWLSDHPQDYPITYHRFSDHAKGGSTSYRKILSSLALRDSEFRRNLASVEHTSNEVAVGVWQKLWQKAFSLEEKMPLQTLGVKSGDLSFYNLITYQFVHAGAFHFLMNLFFFLLLAPLVEAIMGTSLFLFFYLLGGAGGALSYSYLHQNTTTPLVGASGSISFLLGFLCLYLIKEKIYYFYWLLPKKGYYGFVKLSPIWALLIWLLADLGAELSSSAFGSVAHSAHLGGMALGIIVGAIYFYLDPRVGKGELLARGETSSERILTN